MYRYRPPCYHATTTVLIPRPYIGQQSILLPLLLHHAIMQHPASSAVGGGSNFRFGTAWDTCVSFETLETPLGHMCLIWDTLGTLWDTSWDTCLNDRQNFTNRVSCSHNNNWLLVLLWSTYISRPRVSDCGSSLAEWVTVELSTIVSSSEEGDDVRDGSWEEGLRPEHWILWPECSSVISRGTTQTRLFRLRDL